MSYKGMTIYFMRHGETYLNRYGRMQGWSNAPLTDEGKLDVRRSGRGLSDVQFDAVYTSDLHRTIETANIVLSESEHANDLVIQTMPEFREVFFGYFEGLSLEEVYEAIKENEGYDSTLDFFEDMDIPERMAAFKRNDPYQHAEDFMEFWSRIERGLLKVVNEHKYSGDKVLIVCHGLVIRYLIQSLVIELQDADHIMNASITQVQYKSGQFKIVAYNDTSHFIDLEAHELDHPTDDFIR